MKRYTKMKSMGAVFFIIPKAYIHPSAIPIVPETQMACASIGISVVTNSLTSFYYTRKVVILDLK